MTDGANIRAVEALGIDMMGFIFHAASPRCAARVPDYLPSVRRVGVFVDAPQSLILDRVRAFGLDYVQLHGNEDMEACRQLHGLGLRLIKAFHIATAADLEGVLGYADSCDYFLFDTKSPQMGGTGRRFDWGLLRGYRDGPPFFLSGGIGPQSLAELRALSHPLLAGYDLNSKFESAPGVKDPGLIAEFMAGLGMTAV